ncbi:hypothetical protein GCM10009117_23370 [Gangjinia marincola]|uniref:Uncharacterized protein n=1 Tax=Gangjinia marincola TaxID=578463 RepID=A0ABN1MJP1_9FLAO
MNVFKSISLLLIIFFLSCKTKNSEQNDTGVTAIKSNANETTADLNDLSPAEAIAYKNGVEKFKDINKLSFTFNVDRGDNHYERSWIWYPKRNQVTMQSNEDTLTFKRNTLDDVSRKADAAFINDSYWLLAPYHFVWDKGVEISQPLRAVAPISKDSLNKISLTYVGDGGYTPGDAYDFYYDDDFMIKEWIFRQKNQEEPSMMTTWEDYKTVEGMNISTMHQDNTGEFKLYFTNIKATKGA